MGPFPSRWVPPSLWPQPRHGRPTLVLRQALSSPCQTLKRQCAPHLDRGAYHTLCNRQILGNRVTGHSGLRNRLQSGACRALLPPKVGWLEGVTGTAGKFRTQYADPLPRQQRWGLVGM